MKTKDGLAGRADRREERRGRPPVRCGCSQGGGRAGAGRQGRRGGGQADKRTDARAKGGRAGLCVEGILNMKR